MIAFDDSDRPTRPDKGTEYVEHLSRIGEVFQYETDKDVIETFRHEREAEEITGLEGHIGDPFGAHPCLRTPN
jgi:hypothetical protein